MTLKSKLDERRFKAIKGKMLKRLRGLPGDEGVRDGGGLAAKKSAAATSRDEDVITPEEFYGSVVYE